MRAVPSLLLRVLGRPLLWWGIAAAMLVRDVAYNLLPIGRPDAFSVVQAGERWLHDPASIYAETARHLHDTGFVPVVGLIRPPAVAMLGAPFSLLPASWQVPAFTAADAVALVAGLWLLQRLVTQTALEAAVFWAIVFYSPPLFAEIQAGQISGFVLLLACAGMVTFRERPVLSGVLAAASASLKLYPALLVIGARRRWRPFVAGAVAGGVVITVVACIPLGLSGTWRYVTDVLIPSLRAPNPDCAQTSVSTLFGRAIGGDQYPVLNPDGAMTLLQSPIHLPALASVLTVITLLAALVAAVLAARASGWNPLYAMGLGLALGSILPGEVNPYQYLPLLPLVLLITVDAIRKARWARLAFLAAGLLLWIRQPCLLPFPNLWTIAALLLFAVCVSAARDFREPVSRSEA
jgi:glycosyl transferase family 87